MGWFWYICDRMENIIIKWLIEYLLKYPGALIRWIIFRKGKFEDYLNSGTGINSFVVILLIAIILVLVKVIKKYI